MKKLIPYKIFEYNIKNRLEAENYVEANFLRLAKFVPDYENYTEEELKQILADYFTKYPDQIIQLNLYTIGRFPCPIPILQNIGSYYIKYK